MAKKPILTLTASLATIGVLGTLSAGSALALDKRLVGAWAQSKSDCSGTFERRGGTLAFRQPIDVFRSAFIIGEGGISAASGHCKILSATQKGDTTILKLSCSNSVGYVEQTQSIKVLDAGKISRGFAGNDALDLNYEKCAP